MKKEESIIDYGGGVYELRLSDSVSALLNEVDDGAQVFDETSATPVEVIKNYRGYVPWGGDNNLPYNIMKKIRKDEVMSQNKLFNTLTCYSSGLRFARKSGEPIIDTEILDFFKYNRMPRYFLEQATDMKHFFFSVSVIILSKDGSKIVQLRHKEACHTRFETCNPKTGQIEHLFYTNWEDKTPSPDEIEIVPVLDMWNPLGDLMLRMGKLPGADGRYAKPTSDRKFAIVNTFPIAGCKYYPFAYYWSVFLSGWYDIKRLIPQHKKSKLKNSSSLKYHVMVHKDYWESICREEKITDPELKVARVKKEKENIRDFCTGIENSGKMWISGFYQHPDGKEVNMVKIDVIDTSKEGGDWLEDSEEASNMICYADNIHPSLVGATPGKSNNSFSGSVQRELFTMKQALEKPYHDILLEPFFVIKEYNGWEDFSVDVPVITLTTLDKGKDAEENTLRSE
ncbi:MAG: hypothetical protein LBV74_01100 [Tannerella sp.]|jgi:hypothetical protein|nr:hypothetical protein [Tannerella sp.]